MAFLSSLFGLFRFILSIRVKLTRITPVKAREMLKTMMYPKQRPMRNVTLGGLEMMLDEGAFRPGSVLSLAAVGAKTFIVDGYHRLTTIARTGIPMYFVMITYKCKDMAQVDRLYISFDTGMGSRTKADMFVAYYGKKIIEILGKRGVGKLMSAVTFIADSFSQSIARVQTHYPALYCQFAKHFVDSMISLNGVFEGRMGALRRPTVYQQSILSVALITMQWQPRKAKLFWHGVAHNGIMKANDPRQALREFLIDVQDRTRNALNQRARPSPRALSHAVAWAWTQYYEGKSAIEIPGEALAVNSRLNVAGTPFQYSIGSEKFLDAMKDYGLKERVQKMGKYVKTSMSDKKPKSKAEKPKAHTRKRIDFTEKQLKRMAKMREAGRSYAAIAKDFEVSMHTIKRRLDEYLKQAAKVEVKPAKSKRKRKTG